MEVITIESEAWKQLISKLECVVSKFNKKENKYPLPEKWLDGQEVCQLLNISKRTLQTYRDNRTLGFSQIGGKLYYKAAEINVFLLTSYLEPKIKISKLNDYEKKKL